LSAPRILVTRSEPGASQTAERLRAAGYAAIVEPVFAIESIPVELPDFDALAFTSANGVREFVKLSSRRDVPVFCVGARTADEALYVGFGNVASADGDVEALGTLIEDRLPKSARILHTGNEEARGDLTGRLRAAGFTADFVAIFRAVPAPAPGPVLRAHLAGKHGFDAVLVHSPRGAAILADFANGSQAALNVAAISAAAVAPLAAVAGRTEIASRPDEQSLLSALDRLVSS
jgi:uroporphyrinogen-III synthase